ncbi:uncharacterized protein LOC121998743 [Zingiber officinale]|uniref:J domain-containing protein n=1 Tax=Zingiber officinale TaxID=94328 RepID=A0A8J5G8V2_ZINOF|nr:uncharacterized protein LOC121998743 [Zingiber officinale]KAG6502356.1 hypothetical protein ZIOFF_042248 [Zingiber officinale]
MSADGGGREEAARWLEIAERLLRARDLVGCKRFAERAAEADPFVGGGAADQVIAVADVLLASQIRVNNHVDWYAVLQLDYSSPFDRQPSAVLRQYSRFALLLRPDRNHLDGASFAFNLVSDAWAVLSDPSKKALFDSELDIAVAAAAAHPPPPPPPLPRHDSTIWAACTSCFHLHQYGSEYKGKILQCPNCRRTFCATPLQAEPPIVPGTDTYYCSWGFVPLGFDPPEFGAGWKPFRPIFPLTPALQPPSSEQKQAAATPVKATPLVSRKKTMAKKSVGGSMPKKVSVSDGGTRSSERLKARSATIDMNIETQ